MEELTKISAKAQKELDKKEKRKKKDQAFKDWSKLLKYSEKLEKEKRRIGKLSKKKPTLLSTGQQELMGLIDEGLKKGEGPLADLFGQFNEEEFNKGIVEPSMKNFKEKILPQITEKYIASGQSLGSGQLANEIEGATDLQSKLAELKYGAQQNQKQSRLTGLQTSLGRQTHENVIKGPKPAKHSIWSDILPAAGTAIGTYFAGPPGGAAGNATGQLIAGGINNR